MESPTIRKVRACFGLRSQKTLLWASVFPIMADIDYQFTYQH